LPFNIFNGEKEQHRRIKGEKTQGVGNVIGKENDKNSHFTQTATQQEQLVEEIEITITTTGKRE